MEMPRHDMEVLGGPDSFDETSFDPWDEPDDDDGDDSWDFQLDDVSTATVGDNATESVVDGAKPAMIVAAASLKTAATLSREMSDEGDANAADERPRVSPDVFKQGMTVTHPEYGPGKIVALSGSGKGRRATIQFATVGEKKIILSHSAVRPAR